LNDGRLRIGSRHSYNRNDLLPIYSAEPSQNSQIRSMVGDRALN
jgi:hypothetical protein